MLLKLLFLVLSVTSLLCKRAAEESNFSWNSDSILQLEHAFGTSDTFKPRGNLLFSSSRGVTSAKFTGPTELSEDEVEKLKNVAQQGGLYFIRSPVKIGGRIENETGRYVSTFVKACYLYGSHLNEKIAVAVDFYGNVISLSMISPKSDCLQENNLSSEPVFNSTVSIIHQVSGPVPDTQSFIKKLEQEKQEQAAGKGKDNRSFFAKYWMYIVPIVLVLLFNSQADPQEGGGANE